MSKKTDNKDNAEGRDYSKTLFLPKTDFPMRAGLPKNEPKILARWDKINVYKKLREISAGREKYILHDGPPYANGHLHIGHALNKTLKDIVVRSMQMQGYDANYVPGWDCHGLPIEWKIEEKYRQKGKNKDEVPINEFRKECREFADLWITTQSMEFRRLGVEGDFENPYTTMNYAAEATIAGELLKFASSGQLYMGSKPVMWSVVERTALAEAEVEYEDYESDTIWCKFPVVEAGGAEGNEAIVEDLLDASVVIWTTTPWTIPGNRAVSFSSRISYSLYEVTEAPEDNWAVTGDKLLLADDLVEDVMKQSRVEGYKKLHTLSGEDLAGITCDHPLKSLGYEFQVPLLDGDHVTSESGTGFVHTAPGHGRDDFEIWMSSKKDLEERGIDTTIPYTVEADGCLTKGAPGFEGEQVITDKGKKGNANKAVIAALVENNALIARGRVKHQYPHSWRSKKPVIFRNTPQWFVYMDKDLDKKGDTLRSRALNAIDATRFVPETGQNRLRAMIEGRPDWVLSRQRAWGVPICVFYNKDTREVLNDEAVNERITSTFKEEGADAWFEEGAKERFLGNDYKADEWEKVDDILDVWFDSGSTHAFVLEDREDLQSPADLYLEGSDQHRGWFQSSLLESCGTRGQAPYKAVLTHGFVLDEKGRKMSKALGNVIPPEKVIKESGADILRLWVATSDYSDDLRIGNEIIKTSADAYRKMRNTIRWMLGSLAHYEGEDIKFEDMPELERLMLHRLSELDPIVRKAYHDFDFKRVLTTVSNFMNLELSAFYFDIRKDTLYCDPISSIERKAALTVISKLFDTLTLWLAPILPFTMEETWQTRYPSDADSVHFQQFTEIPEEWRNAELAKRWDKVKTVRKVVTGALEIERKEKRIGSSLEAAPKVYIEDKELLDALEGLNFADICITSQIEIISSAGPDGAFRLDDVKGVSTEPTLAEGKKCERCWKILPGVGSDPDYPDISPRDAKAVRELDARL